MLQIRAKILYNKRVKGSYFHLVLGAPGIARESRPGQFLHIRVADVAEPLLRRPFSIHKAKGNDIDILYAVLGQATQLLTEKKSGEHLDLVGPLGNGFDYKPEVRSQKSEILVAGGMGVAPLFFLAQKIARQKPIVLLGAKTKEDILCEEEFKKLGCNVKIATDDGSKGVKGKVTELLRSVLRTTNNEQRTTIYACGPKPMLKEISRISKKYRIPAEVSLEEHMACGIGACLGCVVATTGGFKRVCKEGPVFKADTVIW
ncbi:MAG: dihydroorotate dehydrogenase electron transfer subunit [Candidatus Omnitrophota bacterium]